MNWRDGSCNAGEVFILGAYKYNDSHVSSNTGYYNISICSPNFDSCSIGQRGDNITTLYKTDNSHVGDVGYFNNTLRCLIVDTTYPNLTIMYPQNTTYTTDISDLNYTVKDNIKMSACWYSLDSAVTNTTTPCGTNVTGLISTQGSNKWTMWANDTSNNINKTSVTFWKDTLAPTITIVSPSAITYQVTTVGFNVSTNENTSWCGYSLNGASNVSMTRFNETYFNYTKTGLAEQSHNIIFSCNDTLGTMGSTSRIFGVDTTAPVISLEYPTNNLYLANGTNVYFNYTPTSAGGLSQCELWGNWTGTWHNNLTNYSTPSAVTNTFSQNITDGKYKWNIRCNSTTDVWDWSAQGNLTFTIDTIPPNLTNLDISVTSGSQTISFIYNATDTNLDSCWYSIYDQNGLVDGLNNNITIICNQTRYATTTAFGNYSLYVYAKDKANNEDSISKVFKTEQTAIIIGGGSTSETIIVSEKIITRGISTNFSITTLNYKSNMDVLLAKQSVRPRDKQFLITNKARDQLSVEVICDLTDVNQSANNVNICDYITFSQTKFIVSANEEEPARGTFSILSPPNANFGDKYYFNILAIKKLDNSSNSTFETFSKLSVSSEVSILATLFYKWSNIPLQDEEKEPKLAYPVISLSLSLGILSMALAVFLLRKKYPLTSFLIGVVMFVFLFILIGLTF